MDIKHEESGNSGRYYAVIEGLEAEMTYVKSGTDEITIDHTFVPPQLRGRDIAQKLVVRAVADARATGRKIVPRCSYVARQFDRHADWHDILAR